MTTQARKTNRAGARKAASKNGSSKSRAARAGSAPTPPVEERSANGVMIHRIMLDDGGFSTVPETVGDVKSTEVETILANALENWRNRIRPRKD